MKQGVDEKRPAVNHDRLYSEAWFGGEEYAVYRVQFG